MNRTSPALVASAVLGCLPFGCEAGGVGDPCILELEYHADFAGFDHREVTVESPSFECKTRVCVAHYFQGRASCPYGQTEDDVARGPGEYRCRVPDVEQVLVTVPVEPQLTGRRSELTVYCSCRCKNAQGRTDDGARYCACPSGYDCEKLADDFGHGDNQLAGYYCTKHSARYDAGRLGGECSRVARNCEPSGS